MITKIDIIYIFLAIRVTSLNYSNPVLVSQFTELLMIIYWTSKITFAVVWCGKSEKAWFVKGGEESDSDGMISGMNHLWLLARKAGKVNGRPKTLFVYYDFTVLCTSIHSICPTNLKIWNYV